jgi:hypothetical protein
MDAIKPLHIFKTGRQRAMSGEVLVYSEADLSACARAYDPTLHEAPIVVGHPATNAPAYGWINALTAAGDGLEAIPHQVDPAFAEMVEAGRYKKISASFYLPDSPSNPKPGVLYLRHVGFLGAQPPAVKGLRSPEFAENETGIVEFSDWAGETNAGLWRRLREWLLTKFDQETADQVVPDWHIETLKDAAREPAPEASPIFAEKPDSSTQETEVTPEQKAALEAENASLKARVGTLERERTEAAASARHATHAAYAEQLVAAATIAPKHKDFVTAVLDFAEAEKTLEFGEGEAKKPLAAAFKEFLAGLPKVVEFGEMATKDRAAAPSPTNPLVADAISRQNHGQK